MFRFYGTPKKSKMAAKKSYYCNISVFCGSNIQVWHIFNHIFSRKIYICTQNTDLRRFVEKKSFQDTNETTNQLRTFMNALVVADVWFVNGQKKMVCRVCDICEWGIMYYWAFRKSRTWEWRVEMPCERGYMWGWRYSGSVIKPVKNGM